MLHTVRRFPRTLVGVAGAGAILGALLLTPRAQFVEIETGPGRGDTALAWDRERVGQTFVLRRDGLTAVALAVAPFPQRDSPVELQIRRAVDQTPLRSLHGPAAQFLRDDGATLRFAFPPLSGIRDTPLVLTLAAPGVLKDAAIPVRVEVASGYYPDGTRLINGRAFEGDLGLTAWVRGGWGESWRHRLLVERTGSWLAGIVLITLLLIIVADLTPWAAGRAEDDTLGEASPGPAMPDAPSGFPPTRPALAGLVGTRLSDRPASARGFGGQGGQGEKAPVRRSFSEGGRGAGEPGPGPRQDPLRTNHRHRQFRLILLGSLALALLYTFPLYAHLGNWAHDESDWTEVVSTFAATRHALAAGQLPGWNPYVCGGAPHFANPQAFFMALPLPLALLLGDIVGPKIAVTLVVALGFLGAFLLAQTLGLTGPSAALPGIVFLLSGFTTTHLANGQLLWLTLAWIPWIVLGFLRAVKNPWWSLVAAGFLILTFVEGRLYLVAYGALFLCLLSVILSVQRRSWRPVGLLALIGVLTVLGSAWKFLPTLTFLQDAEISLPNTDGVPLAALDEAFFRRDVTPNLTDRFGLQEIPRHEYAAYVGILPVLLALFSMRNATRKGALPFLIAGGIFLFLATQRADASLLEYLPLARELRNPARMLSMVTFSLGVVSGFGLQSLTDFLKRTGGLPRARRMLPGLLVFLIIGNLLAVSWTHLATLFRSPPSATSFEAPGFFQTNAPRERQVNNGYPAVAAGKGAKDFCPVVLRAYRPAHRVLAREDGGYGGEVRAEGRSRVELLRFTPNALEIAVNAPEQDTVVVNQQYDRGWSADPFLTRNHDTLLAVDVPPGLHTIHLRYHPPLLGVGSAISLTTLVGIFVLWRARRLLSGALPLALRARIRQMRQSSGGFLPRIIVVATVLAATLIVLAPPLPLWGKRHLPHLHKPPFLLSSGHEVRQTLRWEADVLNLVVLQVDRAVPLPPDGELLLTIETPFGARTSTAAFADIPPSGVVLFPLKPALRGRAGGDGTLSLRLAHDEQTIALQYQIAADIYPSGILTLAGMEKPGDLAFQLRYARPALGQRGLQLAYALALIVAGVIVARAVRVRGHPTGSRWWTRRDLGLALAAFLAVYAIYHAALLSKGFWAGASDFSKDAAYLASAGEALNRGAWPIWSHRTCGGMLLLGNPEGNTLSLGTLLATALPADQALLTLLAIEAGLAAAGTFLLGRVLRFSLGASITAAAIASLSASFAYRILEGLTPVGGAVAFIPWVLLALLFALERSQGPAAIATGTLLALMFFRGDVHVVVGVLLVVAVIALCVALQQRSKTPLVLLGVIGATFFLWSSIKLLPYLEQPSLVSGDLPPYVVPLTRMGLLDDALLRLHDRGGVDVRPLHDRRLEQWGNFGAYVGILPLVLAGIGLFARHPQSTVIVAGAVLTFLLSEGELFEVFLRHIGPLGVLLRLPSRLFSIFAVFLGLLAGIGLDRIRRDFPGWSRHVVGGLLAVLIVADLTLATRTVFSRNLEWNALPAPPGPLEPTLSAHQNVSPNHERHATKLLHAGFLLPRICGDQNNPPPFTKEIRDVAPLTTVRSQLLPNRILLDAPTGPSAIIVRERFVPAWTPSRGVVLEAGDGSINLVVPKQEPQRMTLRSADPLARAEKLLFALFLVTLGGLVVRAVHSFGRS